MWHEKNACLSGIIAADTRFAEDAWELVVSGPHIGVANPLQKTAQAVCLNNNHYSPIDLLDVPPNYLPRVNYQPVGSHEAYLRAAPSVSWGSQQVVLNFYRLYCRKMLDSDSERTLIAAIFPPHSAHIHGCVSLTFESPAALLGIAAGFASLPFDFFLRVTGKANLGKSVINAFPLIDGDIGQTTLALRVLLLNCVSVHYAKLWERCFQEQFTNCGWSKVDGRLAQSKFSNLRSAWTPETPLRSAFERRQALLEIDVCVAKLLGLSLTQLITMYRVQFPLLAQYERESFFDRTGRTVYLAGDSSYGLRTPEWKKCKDIKSGTVRTVINDDTLPGGPREKIVEYVAPFDRCDREQDYATAWKFFEEQGL